MLTSAEVECTENKKIIVSIHMKTYCPLIKINDCKYFILVYHFRNQTLKQERAKPFFKLNFTSKHIF